jgi:hypothetical protein
MPADKR